MLRPGKIIINEGEIIINSGRADCKLVVANTGDRPVQVGSHFHFFETNRNLRFPREKAFGKRLNIPAGTAVRFEPGDEKEVSLVEIGGFKSVYGLNNLTDGSVKDEHRKIQALLQARWRGFKGGDSNGSQDE